MTVDQVLKVARGVELTVVERSTDREGVATRVTPPCGVNPGFVLVEWFDGGYSYVKREDLEVVG